MFKVLVMEDNKDLNQTVCSFLNQSGYETTGCLDANDTYNVMYNSTFDLIVPDIMMPGIDDYMAKSIELDKFWDLESNTAPRAVDVYRTKLRDKFSDCDEFQIVTVHDLGCKAVLK